jgi:hypothetical protein
VVTVHALAVDQLNTYDVLVNDEVVFTEAALAEYVARSTGMASPPSTSSGRNRRAGRGRPRDGREHQRDGR